MKPNIQKSLIVMISSNSEGNGPVCHFFPQKHHFWGHDGERGLQVSITDGFFSNSLFSINQESLGYS